MTIEDTLREAARDLDGAIDALTKSLGEAERRLVSLKLGVVADVKLGEGNGVLSFRKVGTVWGLYVMHHGESLPLRSASKGARVAAANAMGPMLLALVAEAEKQLAATVAAVEVLDGFLEEADKALGPEVPR